MDSVGDVGPSMNPNALTGSPPRAAYTSSTDHACISTVRVMQNCRYEDLWMGSVSRSFSWKIYSEVNGETYLRAQSPGSKVTSPPLRTTPR